MPEGRVAHTECNTTNKKVICKIANELKIWSSGEDNLQ